MIDIKNSILDVVKEVGLDQENPELYAPTTETALFDSNLDSIGIVYLIAEIEDRIYTDLGITITLADERAMSQKTSPFRSVRTLTEYTKKLVEEEHG